ncbi:MAG: hypothetical protein WCG26_05720 [Chloroflexales bacterium]
MGRPSAPSHGTPRLSHAHGNPPGAWLILPTLARRGIPAAWAGELRQVSRSPP